MNENKEIKKSNDESSEEIVIEKYTTKSWLNSAISGFLIGLGVILPGISGSTIAILFKIYDKMLYAISKIFKKFKTSIIYLLPIIVGAIIGFVLGFFVVQSVIEAYTFIVVCIFGGLMLGASPEIFLEIKDDIKKPKWYQIALLVIGFAFPIVLAATFANVKEIDNTEMLTTFPFYSYIVAFFLGVVVSLTQIVPGLSATVLLMSLGFFKPIMEALHVSVIMDEPRWIAFILLLVLGFLVGFFLLSKVMSFFFKKYRLSMYFLITGLTFGSIVSVFYNSDVKEVYDNWSIGKGNMALDLGIGIPLFVIFTIIAFMLVMYQKKKDKAINDQSLNATK